MSRVEEIKARMAARKAKDAEWSEPSFWKSERFNKDDELSRSYLEQVLHEFNMCWADRQEADADIAYLIGEVERLRSGMVNPSCMCDDCKAARFARDYAILKHTDAQGGTPDE